MFVICAGRADSLSYVIKNKQTNTLMFTKQGAMCAFKIIYVMSGVPFLTVGFLSVMVTLCSMDVE